MSWSELERLVEDAESGGPLAEALHQCRSRSELVLTARREGYRITQADLARAWREHRRKGRDGNSLPSAGGLG